ncbi:hypothetical protein ACFYZI_25515 [Streptomyces griseorubiginosus]|uniref:Calcium-binding protein n=1 Tax=Streptomyces griseorubiginosus TaxID=67304 RepID=A0A101RS84_9ACTN|nr:MULTISPECIES: hypothetical protein [Streptomyces]AYC40439.1 hypothetical protein DWG14_04704 [Streptomyces griseorubiginosus]KUM67245.1 hypothetical protein AQI84_41225 [Streptomyces griseorubiginosus]KUN60685.1 hypothetical protein AQJ54_36315 [Streptomyces griseorubiginosus]TCR21229.1 hypothetical protein EV578_106369 [Streptomyces sp. BK205]
MRTRALVLAASGAVALSALAVPAAQAATPAAGPAVTFSQLKVNSGKNIVVGSTAQVTVSATYTVTKPANLDPNSFQTGPVLYRGATLGENSDDLLAGDGPGTCTVSSSTVLKCSAKIQFRPKSSDQDLDLFSSEAGTWKLGALAVNADSGITWQGGLGSTHLQRKATLTTDASPEPVTKGRTITVTGKLSRANWDTNKYAGYSTQPVKLQFKKKGATTWSTLKTIKSSSTGALKTTTKATADGYFRYVFAGTTTTSPVNSSADFVDVR